MTEEKIEQKEEQSQKQDQNSIVIQEKKELEAKLKKAKRFSRITVASVPVGGYSASPQKTAPPQPVNFYIATLTIPTATLIITKEKQRKNADKNHPFSQPFSFQKLHRSLEA